MPSSNHGEEMHLVVFGPLRAPFQRHGQDLLAFGVKVSFYALGGGFDEAKLFRRQRVEPPSHD